MGQLSLFDFEDDAMEEHKSSESIQKELKIEPPAYFPAFRTMIEAWASSHRGTSVSTTGGFTSGTARRNDPYRLNSLARELFGKFVPDLRYPSLSDTASRIARVAEKATYEVARNSQDMFSEAFVEAYRAILSNSGEDVNDSIDNIVSEIYDLQDKIEKKEILSSKSSQSSSSDMYKRIGEMLTTVKPLGNPAAVRVLSMYRKSLREQNDIQSKIYAPIEKYLDSVNEFLEGKKIAILPQQSPTSRARVALVFDNSQTAGLQSLSSGEQQIVSMLYAASPALTNTGSIVLIDEPEISLHIDWQRKLLHKMQQQLGERQIIVCTHSPEIGGDYLEAYQEVELISHSYQDLTSNLIETGLNDKQDVDEESL